MDKNALKKYAVWARRELMLRVSQRAVFYGVTESDYGDAAADSVNGRVLSPLEKNQRQALIEQIQKKGYQEVIEEVAYTWFNRFLALRFMEVNGYLPAHIRIFTDENNQFKPQILAEAIHLELEGLDIEQIYAYKESNQTEELFKYLLIIQCNALNTILPKMFQKIEDYTELLLPDKLLREGSVIEQMIALIPEEDWKDAVQIIGWLYQYYNSEKKDGVFAALKRNVKITKENIPAATQLFTPDWIVRYMVENSLGRLWLEGHPNEELKANWRYYLEEAKQEPEVEAELQKIRAEYAKITPEDIRCIDPCQGSGHILVYLFDVLMQIYEAYGYTTQEAVASIINKNLYGLDIDERAAQLSYFAVMMKACQYDKRFLRRKDENGQPKVPQPSVYAIQESNDMDRHVLAYFCNGNEELKEAMDTIVEELHDAKEYGSIITVTQQNWDALYARFDEIKEDISFYKEDALKLLSLVQVAQALAQKYDVVVTNPPYMGISGGNTKLSEFVKKNYPDSKTDLFAVFIESCKKMLRRYGYQAMITQHAWMFLTSYENLRNKLLEEQLINMAHLGARAFNEISGEVVQTTSFVFRKGRIKSYIITFIRMLYGYSEEQKQDIFLSGEQKFYSSQKQIEKIQGKPYTSYWASKNVLDAFENGLFVGNVAEPRVGMATANNERFVRLWQEVDKNKIALDVSSRKIAVESRRKWFPFAKGGEQRKWYGNNDTVVNWENDGVEIQNFKDAKTGKVRSHNYNLDYIFNSALTWTVIGTEKTSFRYCPIGFLYSNSGYGMFCNDENLKLYLLAFMNSKIVSSLLQILSPSMGFESGYIRKLPLVISNRQEIAQIAYKCIDESKTDWNSFETSWDFQQHPLIRCASISRQETEADTQKHIKDMHYIEDAFTNWNNECNTRFNQLKSNEEELNRIFIDIYGLQDELTPEVADKDVTVRKADLQRDIKSLISYAVGCMFGRYSLDKEGLIFAGGRMEDKFAYYGGTFADTQNYQLDGTYTFGELGSKFYYLPVEDKKALECWKVDADNIIPIMDDEYFEDDIVEKFVAFICSAYGEQTLGANLQFIADALGGKGQPKEVIRNYFINDFYKDHCKIYQKRPIYWLFDSGKKNGFKCLIYMHRYQPDTIARIRTDYVHEQQSRYRTAIADLEHRVVNAGTSERVKLNKSLKKIQEQADELHAYEEKIHHLADQMIAIDLDDGVKHNYEIFQDVLAKIK